MIGNKGIILQSWLNVWNSVKNTLGVAFTSDLVDASITNRGFVNTISQTFSGAKTFENIISQNKISISNNSGFSGSTQASMWKDPTFGLCIRTAFGSSYDLVFFDPAGNLTIGVGGGFNYFGGSTAIFTQQKIYFDGGSNTYAWEKSSDNLAFVIGSVETLNIVSGKLGIKNNAPTASLHLPPSTGVANDAPLKFTAGVLGLPENGSFDFDGTNLYFTIGSTRKTVVLV